MTKHRSKISQRFDGKNVDIYDNKWYKNTHKCIMNNKENDVQV